MTEVHFYPFSNEKGIVFTLSLSIFLGYTQFIISNGVVELLLVSSVREGLWLLLKVA